MELDAGAVVDGRYTVEGMLGEGGMARVYRVLHNKLGRRYALKVLTVESKSVRERLLQEGRVQANLQHPNVVNVIDVVEIDHVPGLVMEYVAGPTLDDLLAERRLEVEEAERLMLGIINGVRAAHELGLIHRDLKPSNVLLAVGRGQPIPKVADFGLAKILEVGVPTEDRTRAGTSLGTPAYMAPEQITDAKSVDARADIWSLGAILYRIATGRRAFAGSDLNQILEAVQAGDFMDPRKLNKDLTKPFEDAILGALRVDLEERIPNCDYLQQVLEGREPTEENTVLRERALLAGAVLESDNPTLLQGRPMKEDKGTWADSRVAADNEKGGVLKARITDELPKVGKVDRRTSLAEQTASNPYALVPLAMGAGFAVALMLVAAVYVMQG